MSLPSIVDSDLLKEQLFSNFSTQELFYQFRVQSKAFKSCVDSFLKNRAFDICDRASSLEQSINVIFHRLFLKRVFDCNSCMLAVNAQSHLIGAIIKGGLDKKFVVRILQYNGQLFTITSTGDVFVAMLDVSGLRSVELDFKVYPIFSQTVKIKEIVKSNKNGLFFLSNEGQVFAKGKNTDQHLGLGNTGYVCLPKPVSGELEGVVVDLIRSSFGFTIAVSDSGLIYGWGKNKNQRLLISNTELNVIMPKLILNGFFGQEIEDIILCEHGFLLQTKNGQLYSFISVTPDQLAGINSQIQEFRVLEDKRVLKVVSDGACVFVLTEEKKIYVLGGYKCPWDTRVHPTRYFYSVPKQISDVFSYKNVKQIVASEDGKIVVALEDGNFYLHTRKKNTSFTINIFELIFTIFPLFNMLLYLMVKTNFKSLFLESICLLMNSPMIMYFYLKGDDELSDDEEKIYNFTRVFDPFSLSNCNLYPGQKGIFIKTMRGETFKLDGSFRVKNIEEKMRGFGLRRSRMSTVLFNLAYMWGYYPCKYLIQRYLDELKGVFYNSYRG